MKSLLEQFLFRYNYCPLPGLGTLEVITKPAIADWGHKTIQSPKHEIVFHAGKLQSADTLLQYISLHQKLSLKEAENMIVDFCTKLTTPSGGNIFEGTVGVFVVGENGTPQFTPVQYPASWMPTIAFERVVRQDIEHTIMVGDRERSSSFMQNYFDSLKNINTYNWRIAAFVLLLLALSLLTYYLIIHGASSGNVLPINSGTEPSTYQLIQP